ncbi:MAG: hypothetical protein ACLFUI_05560 [Halanaerobiales bacterium]
MKETVKSLKIYFIIVGVVGIFLVPFILASDSILARIFLGIDLLFAIAFIHTGIKMKDYLKNRREKLLYLIAGRVLYGVILFAIDLIFYNVSSEDLTAMIIQLVFHILIGGYLYYQVKNIKLEEESLETAEGQIKA